MLKADECGDSRLACVDCKGQVCPKCFVECPVGNRCKECARKFNSHVLNVSAGALVVMFITSFIMGAGFGVLQGFVPSYGFFMWLIVYAFGVAAGNVIHKVIGFKIGSKVMATATVGVMMGWVGAMHYGPTPSVAFGGRDAARQRSLAGGPETYRISVSNYFRTSLRSHNEAALANIQAQAQQRLPELVAAFNRHDECWVMTSTADGGASQKFEWKRVTKANNEAVEVAPNTAATAPNQDNATTVPAADVYNWQFVSPKIGMQTSQGASSSDDDESDVSDAAPNRRTNYGLLDAIIFLAGIITVLSGQVPQFRLPFWR